MLSNSRIAASRSLDNADAAVVALTAAQASTAALAATVSVPTAPDTIVKRDATGAIAVNGLTATDTVINGNLTVNGTATTINTVNLNIEDQNITLNKGGAALSAGGAGISIEEGGATTGYMRIAATRDVIEMKAPTSGVMTLNQSLTTLDAPTFAALKLTTGAGANNVLSSDASGNSSWVASTSSATANTVAKRDGSSGCAFAALTAASLTTSSITGGSTVDLFATSGTINAACGAGVQTLNVGVSGGGATAINLGGSNDTVTLGGTTAANGALTITAVAQQLKLSPSVTNAEASILFNTGGAGTQWTLGQGSYAVGSGNFGIGATGMGSAALKITSAGAISTPYSFAATGTVTGSNITTLTSDVAANKATLAAATSSATASTLAMRGPASQCSFGALTASTIQLTTGAGASKVLTSDASGNGTWVSPPSQIVAYSAGTTYQTGALATYNGVLYKSLLNANVGNTPNAGVLNDSLFTLSSPVPGSVVGSGSQSYSNHFIVNSASTLTAIRHYQLAGNVGANLYVWQVAPGLGSATLIDTIANPFAGSGTTGWQDTPLTTPLTLVVGTVYTVSKDSDGQWYQAQPPNYPVVPTLFSPQLINGTTGSFNSIGANWPDTPTSDTNYFISPVVSAGSGGTVYWEAIVSSPTIAPDVAANKATLAAATSSATGSTLAMRDTYGNIWFHDIVATGAMVCTNDSDQSYSLGWTVPLVGGALDVLRLVRKNGVVFFSLEHYTDGTGSGSSGLITLNPSIASTLLPFIMVEIPITVNVNGSLVIGTFSISPSGDVSVQLSAGANFTGTCGLKNLHGCYVL